MHSIATTAPSLQGSLAGVMPSAVVATRRAAPLTALRILGNALLIAALLCLNMAGTVGASIFFAILAVMVVLSPEAAYKSLAICYLGLLINNVFVPKSLVWTPGRIALPFLALIRFGIDLAVYRLSPFSRLSYVSLLVFAFVMALCSILSGWYTQIALLKIVYFVAFATTVLAGTAVLRHRRADLGEWFVSLILAAALLGIIAIAINEDNNFRPIRADEFGKVYGTFFNGAFVHPNAHAVYGTMFVTFLGLLWLLSTYRQRWLVLPIMACWAAFIVWSASRTALVACAAALALTVFYAKPLRNRLGWRLRPAAKRRTLVGLLALAVVVGMFWDISTGNALGKAISSFIVKGSVSTTDYSQRFSVDRILSSRKGLIDYSWQNFLKNPLTGIGFGVSKTEAFERSATYFTAPSEKGFLPTAILEEGGVLGATAFVIFLGCFSWDLFRQRNVPGLIAFLVFVVTNLGEVTMFAPGGAGSFAWIMVGAAMLLSDRCWTPPTVRVPAPAGIPQGRT